MQNFFHKNIKVLDHNTTIRFSFFTTLFGLYVHFVLYYYPVLCSASLCYFMAFRQKARYSVQMKTNGAHRESPNLHNKGDCITTMHLLGYLSPMVILLCLLCITLWEMNFNTTEENGSSCQASSFGLCVCVCVCVGGGEVSGSKLARHWLFRLTSSMFLSAPPRKCRDKILKYITTSFFHILSNSFFFVALRPNAGHCLLILEVSRSHTTTHHSR